MSPRARLACWLAACVAGAGAVLVASGQTWHHSAGRAITGGEAAPALGPLAWAALAGTAALLATRGLARRLVGVIIACCGVFIVVTAPNAPSATVWPQVALAGGVLLIVSGLAATAFSRGWPAMSGRFDRGSKSAPPEGKVTDRGLWDEIDRGNDPTL